MPCSGTYLGFSEWFTAPEGRPWPGAPDRRALASGRINHQRIDTVLRPGLFSASRRFFLFSVSLQCTLTQQCCGKRPAFLIACKLCIVIARLHLSLGDRTAELGYGTAAAVVGRGALHDEMDMNGVLSTPCG